MAKKILIVSNSYYPEITPRAFRTFELAKEFARKGNRVTVVLPNREKYVKSAPAVDGIDILYGIGEMEKEGGGNVAKNRKYRKVMPPFLQKAALYFYNHELFVKYNKGVYKRLAGLTGEYDALISISYPAAIHLAVSRAMKKNSGLRSAVKIAEFSDPPFKGDFARAVCPCYYSYLRKWGKQFDYFVVPVENAAGVYTPYADKDKIKVIPQGFDMSAIKTPDYTPHTRPTFAYAGRFYENIRDPKYFFDFLRSLDRNFRFDLYLNHLDSYFWEMILDAQKKSKGEIIIHEAIPREELLEKLSSYDFLINFENTTPNATPSKLIDYALTKRPIFSFGPKNFDKTKLLDALDSNYHGQIPPLNTETYNVKNIADQFLKLFH